MPRRRVRSALVYALAVLVGGCGLPVSTFQGPVPVPVETGRVGIGVGPVFLEEPDELFTVTDMLVMGMYMGLRVGVIEGLDIGGSIGMWNGLAGDVKYAVLRGPIHVAGSLGASVNPLIPDMVGIHPAVLVGWERLYGGGKLMIYPLGDFPMRMSVVFLGASVGGSTRLVPEIARMHDPDMEGPVWVAGLKVQRLITMTDIGRQLGRPPRPRTD